MSKTFRFLCVLFSLGLACYWLYPSVWWYFITDPEMRTPVTLSKTDLRDYIEDLADDDIKKFKEMAPDAVDYPAEIAYIEQTAKIYAKNNSIKTPDSWTAYEVSRIFGSEEAMRSEIENVKLLKIMKQRSMKERVIGLGLDLNGGVEALIAAEPKSLQKKVDELKSEGSVVIDAEQEVMQRTVLALNARINSFGLTEPEIRLMEGGRINILIPAQEGDSSEPDSSVIDRFLSLKGGLTFQLVDEEARSDFAAYLRANPETESLINDGELEGYDLPLGRKIYGYYEKDAYGLDKRKGYQVLEEEVQLSGENITSARRERNPETGSWEINYTLDSEGSIKFSRLLSDFGGREMAIVIDDRVVSSPRISTDRSAANTVSRGGRITGNFTDEEALNLSNVLNSGDIPVNLEIDSLQTVGATLGNQTIQSGLYGIALGFALVILFMIIWYKGAGIIASIMLILNLFLLMGLLSVMHMTLTMTSIAGVILTVGMSVDANVIIFERIKEELRLGKTRVAAIESGFAKAFWTIMDANITTGIAASFLAFLADGGIRGFAITLAVGIVCSLFTAVFVSRLVFDFFTETVGRRKISISWGGSQR